MFNPRSAILSWSFQFSHNNDSFHLLTFVRCRRMRFEFFPNLPSNQPTACSFWKKDWNLAKIVLHLSFILTPLLIPSLLIYLISLLILVIYWSLFFKQNLFVANKAFVLSPTPLLIISWLFVSNFLGLNINRFIRALGIYPYMLKFMFCLNNY